ncbi:protein starmaker-like [Tiliqua scincoides]|uniref:protein starmaker-like n=1 Tax=Tiliqua scincoides TaxID=71010 RepID=UPI0034636B69
MDEIKIANGKVVKIQVEKKGADEHTMISRKLNGEDRSGITKPAPKGDVRDYSFSGSHVDVAGAIKPHKKDDGREGAIKERTSSHRKAAGISKTHQNSTGEVGNTGKLSSQEENPVYTTTGKTGQQEVMLSGKLTDQVSGSGVTKSHPKIKDEVTVLKIISGSRVSGPGSIQEGRKGDSGISIIHRKSNTGEEGFGFISTHPKDVGDPKKINRKTHEGPKMQGKGSNRLEITFQEANQDIVKGNIENRKVAGDHKRNNMDSSKGKAEHSGQKSTGIKSALSLHHGSHDTIKRGPDVPKKDDQKSPEHSSFSYKKVTKTSKQRSKDTIGTDSGIIAKKHHGHSGTWRRKSSRPDKKKQSVKHVRGSDSSQSSESDEDSRNDSRQSYKDYQNDTPDSHQSAESVEQNHSVESHQSDDDHSQMEDQGTYSQERSHEHKHN